MATTTPAAEIPFDPELPCTWLVSHYAVCSGGYQLTAEEMAAYPDHDSFVPCGQCEDGGGAQDCGAASRPIVRDGKQIGWECANGHSHIDAQARQELGIEYAEDDTEARRLMAAGVEPLAMNGDRYPF